MRTLLLLLTFSILIISCKKEKLSNTIYGDWYFTEAYETDNFDDEYDLLLDYESITITFNRDNSFIWFQYGSEYTGSYNIEINKVTLNFDNGDQEVWKNYTINKNILSYSYYNDNDSYFEFTLKKVTTNYSRR